MKFQILTIFPSMFQSYFNDSIIKRAQDKKLIDIKIHDLRDFTTDKHRSVDDTPYGGGAGMVMRVDVIARALSNIVIPANAGIQTREITNYKLPARIATRSVSGGQITKKSQKSNLKRKIILLSAKGKTWNQQLAKRYSKLDEVILICGRYEGVDERVKYFIDEEISVGDYVLTGGELGAMIMVDSIARLLPGVLGNADSLKSESHNVAGQLEYPQYTKPASLNVLKSKVESKQGETKILKVPKVLLSGDHGKIEEWRKGKSKVLMS